MPSLFVLTLLLSASLLFTIQPMVGKLVLPLLGGTPAVWTGCMMFFQAELLVGYAYAHFSATRLSLGRQIALQVSLLTAGLLFLPLSMSVGPTDASTRPLESLLALLARTAGPPVLAVAASAPLLQRWFSLGRDPQSRDPFFLYAASNLGSLGALLAYPFVIEPFLTLSSQRVIWMAAYGGLIAMTGFCGWAVRGRQGASAEAAPSVSLAGAPPGWRQRARWIVLAFAPSSLMLGTTTFLSTDVAAVPLLWVLPLALYLTTYVLAFARRSRWPVGGTNRLLPAALAAALFIVMRAAVIPLVWALPIHLIVLFAAALICHSQLAAERPDASRLTDFYLCLSFGGLLGGIANTLIAPLVFTHTLEYPLALALVAFLRPARPLTRFTVALSVAAVVVTAVLVLRLPTTMPASWSPWPSIPRAAVVTAVVWLFAIRPRAFACAMAALVLLGGARRESPDTLLYAERSFFGTHEVTQINEFRILRHGTTTHGGQSTLPDRACTPLTYYFRTGPVGQVFESFTGAHVKSNVAVVGLGAGALSAYYTPGQVWTFYEINPAVVRIAENPEYFTYLRDCIHDQKIVLGDARMRLADAPDHGYGAMFLDAFSSDSLPMHLITREAVELYTRKLATGGVLVFNISNRYLDLAPQLGRLAQDTGLSAFVEFDGRVTPAESQAGKFGSIWVVMARRDDDLGDLLLNRDWHRAPVSPGRVWTDDYSNIVSAFTLRGPRAF